MTLLDSKHQISKGLSYSYPAWLAGRRRGHLRDKACSKDTNGSPQLPEWKPGAIHQSYESSRAARKPATMPMAPRKRILPSAESPTGGSLMPIPMPTSYGEGTANTQRETFPLRPVSRKGKISRPRCLFDSASPISMDFGPTSAAREAKMISATYSSSHFACSRFVPF